jgi:hypothetical protein
LAQAPAAAPPAAGAPAEVPAAAGPAAPTPASPRPFKDIIKDAKMTAGFFTTYQKDEKVWLAIKPEQFDKPFFFTYNIPQSVGERGLYGSQMGGADMAVFKKIGNQIQLIAKNAEFYATPGTPQAQFVSEGFSDSLLSSATAVSAADPETKAIVLIGEIGGDSEEKAADYISKHVTKPVVAYVAGFTAPEGKTMGHAGAIVSGSAGTAQAKQEAFEAVGVKVGKTPSETAALMREIISKL